MKNKEHIDTLIQLAIKEDIGSGDHSSLACFQDDTKGHAKLYAKEDGVVAGVALGENIFHAFDESLEYIIVKKDGENVVKGDIIAEVKGNKRNILTAERTVLNFMQRLSGVATQTNNYVKLISHTKAKVLDTRKTTPGYRSLEKMAVKMGGGENHRHGLYDMIMLKDNHIDFSGGIDKAIAQANDYIQEKELNIPIEIEVRNFNELNEVLNIGRVQRIMLDNFTVEDTKKAVTLIDGRFEVESSGGITFQTIKGYAETGVDYISVGALTHHIESLDISLLVD